MIQLNSLSRWIVNDRLNVAYWPILLKKSKIERPKADSIGRAAMLARPAKADVTAITGSSPIPTVVP